MGLYEDLQSADVVIVGSGLYGLTMAERFASIKKRVVLVEAREHIGGNAWSYIDENTGIEVHRYGSHIFHTSNKKIFEYVSRFTELSPYRHKVFGKYSGQTYSLPINLATINQYFGRSFSPVEARELISKTSQALEGAEPQNLEAKAISLIGLELYEAFVRGYTAKQWQTDPKDLSPEIIARLPVRFNFNNDYFSDLYQGIPARGYGIFIAELAAASADFTKIYTGVDFFEIREVIRADQKLIYTGPLDKYFDYTFGHLTWRTLDFEIQTLDVPDYQGTAVINYNDLEIPYTRIHEFKHYRPELDNFGKSKTVIMKEYSRFAESSDEPYYPVNSSGDREKLLNTGSWLLIWGMYTSGVGLVPTNT